MLRQRSTIWGLGLAIACLFAAPQCVSAQFFRFPQTYYGSGYYPGYGGYGSYGAPYAGMNYGGSYYGPGYSPGFYMAQPAYQTRVYPGFGATMDYYPRKRQTMGPAISVNPNSPLLDLGPIRNPKQAEITVLVPANAQVWFDGKLTQQTGTTRNFTTPSLGDARYSYEIRAQWTDAQGQSQSSTKTVNFRSGDVLRVDFTS